VRPLLKWAGGKRQLLPHLRRFYPPASRRYFEPFLGSAAVFFDLVAAGRPECATAHLTDSNADLIGCYASVRADPEAVIAALRRLAAGHLRDGAAHYYRIRDRFNEQRRRRCGASEEPYTPALAAMLIYLNRTGYNGLFRLNAAGEFNVPAGRYARPTVCDADLVRGVARALDGVSLASCTFDRAVAPAEAGDFLYFDPPYAPLSSTSAFGAYTASRFSESDQVKLCHTVRTLADRGCHVILSNSSAPSIERVYRQAVSSSSGRLTLWRVPARRAINSRAAGRGYITELLLTNVEPQPASDGLAAGAVRLAP
jgi:DNA adenine methylase